MMAAYVGTARLVGAGDLRRQVLVQAAGWTEIA